MKKIRLLFMIPTLGQGGAEKVLINLVNNLDKTRFDVTVLTLFDTGVNKQFLHSDVHYCFCMKRSFRGNGYYSQQEMKGHGKNTMLESVF